jgi:hypothetical protein
MPAAGADGKTPKLRFVVQVAGHHYMRISRQTRPDPQSFRSLATLPEFPLGSLARPCTAQKHGSVVKSPADLLAHFASIYAGILQK